MTMKCSDVQSLLPWAVNQSLTSEETVQVFDHVRHCPACLHELAFTIQLGTSVKHLLTEQQPSAAFTNDLWQRIRTNVDAVAPAAELDSALSTSGLNFELSPLSITSSITGSITNTIVDAIRDSLYASFTPVARRLEPIFR